MYFLQIVHQIIIFNRIAPSNEGDFGFEPWPAPFMDFQDAMAGSAGLRGNIIEFLNWGIMHLPNTPVEDDEMAEAIKFGTQVKHTRYNY